MGSADHTLLIIVLTYVATGWIKTGMLEAGFNLTTIPARARQDAIDRLATHGFGHPQNIATIASWLASEEARFVTGQIFTVYDGLTVSSPINPALT